MGPGWSEDMNQKAHGDSAAGASEQEGRSAKGTSEGRQERQRGVLPQPRHGTLSDVERRLIYYRRGETEKEESQARARHRTTAQRLQFCFLTGGDSSVKQLTEWLAVN